MPAKKALVGLLLLALAWSCTTQQANVPGVLVGEVEGGEALVAIVQGEGGFTAYTCGVDSNLSSHTGWFFGEPQAEVIPLTTSASGLVLEGRLEGDRASGTLRLASGEIRSWQAGPAHQGAGIFSGEDALALTGLIILNDGRMAGNAKLSAPVAIATGTAPSVAVTVPSPPTTTTTPVPVTFPVGTVPRTIPLMPVLKPRTITRTGPTVIFLVHGMSDSINTPGTNAIEDAVKCEGPRNTPFYSRCEWGIDFIPGLFGVDPAKDARLFNLAGHDLSGKKFLTSRDDRPLIDENIGITNRDANGCVKSPATANEIYDPKAALHFATVAEPVPGKAPGLSVFVTWRDSTRGVVESGHRIGNQAYAALRWYEEEYKTTPAVIFVAQSFGGLASRFILSNPPPEVFDTPLLNADNIVVCPEDRAKMDYLRDRTVFFLSLATPHEGSFMSEWGEPPKQVLRSALNDLRTGLDNTELGQVFHALDSGLAHLLPTPPNLVARAENEITRLLNLLDTPALRDMKLATMRANNMGPLSPERARRSAGSPIAGAQGALVPIYATLGRSPGGAAFDSPDILGGFGRYNRESEKEKGWFVSTMFFSDMLTKQFIPNGFGKVDPADAPFLDRRARLFDLSHATQSAESFVKGSAESILPSLSLYFGGQFGASAAGVLAYLEQFHIQVFVPGAVVPISTDRVWKLGLSGSVQVPMAALRCGAQTVVLDYDPLVRALLTTFSNTQAVLDAVANKNPTELVQAAGGAIEDGAELALGTAQWLVGKLNQFTTASDDCRLPASVTSVTDFFALANIVNWHLGSTTGTIPAPAWERTDIPVRDGEIDNDGPVHASSALGYTLGRRAFFFEHDREDGPIASGKATLGSWYRLYDNPVTEKYNHGMQYQNDVGLWISTQFLVGQVGPVPQRTGFSNWP